MANDIRNTLLDSLHFRLACSQGDTYILCAAAPDQPWAFVCFAKAFEIAAIAKAGLPGSVYKYGPADGLSKLKFTITMDQYRAVIDRYFDLPRHKIPVGRNRSLWET